MGKQKTFTTDDAVAEVVSAFEKFMQTLAAKGGSKVAPADDEEEVEDDDEDEEVEALDRAEVESLKIKELRELAKEYLGDEAPTKKQEILDALEDFFDDEEDEDEEDEEEDEDDEEDEDEESDEWDRDSLEEEDLKSLRKIAKEDFEIAASDIKGLDKDALIDLMLGEDEEEDEDDEEDEDEDDVEELGEDELKAMTQPDLIALAKELDVKVPKTLTKKSAANKKKIVALILDSGEDEE